MGIIQVQAGKNIVEDVMLKWKSKCKHHDKKHYNKIRFAQTKTNSIPP
jgi:hypothetical protein